jgi:hypothetical protein
MFRAVRRDVARIVERSGPGRFRRSSLPEWLPPGPAPGTLAP